VVAAEETEVAIAGTGAAFVAGGKALADAATLTSAAFASSYEAVKVSTIASLKSEGLTEAHHIIQNAAVKNIPGYSETAAPGIQLPGPSYDASTPHGAATAVQKQAGGGTYGAERRIAYKALRIAGLRSKDARAVVEFADKYFHGLGVTTSTQTRIPGNRP
jgi:hypothetical protein